MIEDKHTAAARGIPGTGQEDGRTKQPIQPFLWLLITGTSQHLAYSKILLTIQKWKPRTCQLLSHWAFARRPIKMSLPVSG